jgi:hypothetical protein
VESSPLSVKVGWQTLVVVTLEEIEGEVWPDPAAGSSYLVRRCNELRRKPIDEFSIEDLRIMIGQAIGLESLVSRALDAVEVNPMVSGDFYEGDLLSSLFAVPETYWTGHADQWLRLTEIARQVAVIGEKSAHFLDTSRGGA